MSSRLVTLYPCGPDWPFPIPTLLRESPNPARRVAPGTPVQVERAAGGREQASSLAVQ